MLNVLRTWPYFKFYPNDWLTSNTVKLMNNAQRGAYIDLLCTAWSEESCTLPPDMEALQKLSHWDGTADEFAPILSCFPLTRNRKRRYNPRLLAERQEALAYRTKQSEGGKKGMEARWAKKGGVHEKRSTAHASRTDWLTTLRANPLYAHVNFDQELEQMQRWKLKPKNKNRQINESFVINWINKIDKPLANGHGISLSCAEHPTLTFPDKQAKDHHDVLYHPKYVG